MIILVVAFFPILYSVILSLTDSTITGIGSFVGVENYVEMVQNDDFLEGLRNTVVFTVVSVFFEFIIGLGIALAINRAFRGRGLVRAAVLVPWAFPTVISAVMWRLMFQDQVGVINYVVNTLGIISQPILSDRTLLLIAAIGVDVWKTTPFMALLLLAGLQTIPASLSEAATLDGATPMQRFWHITLPMLTPIIAVVMTFSVLFTFTDFQLIYVLTRGGPLNATHLMATLSFQRAIPGGQLGEGAAIAVAMIPFLLAAILFSYFGLQRRRWQQGGGD